MRRDVFIENDSGGLSVVAASAIDAIIDDGRSDDSGFVERHQAMLVSLLGDDAMPVRIVLDEDLSADESDQWLAHASWRIEAADGRILVMGGFDPDVLRAWRDDGKGSSLALADVAPGAWRVDVYAHVGSMNGRGVLLDASQRPGAAFRRSHPDKPFPAWLAQMLSLSSADDPRHEHLWRHVEESVREGQLAIAPEPASFVGFLVHLTPFSGSLGPAPPDAWFDAEHGARVPKTFPLGIAASVPDPRLAAFLDRALGRAKMPAPAIVSSGVIPLIESWSGPILSKVDAPFTLRPQDAYHLHWLACLASNAAPRYELLVTDAPGWSPPASTEDFGVVAKGRGAWSIGPPRDAVGWSTWWSARKASATLETLPDGASLHLAMRRDDAGGNPDVGRMLFSGVVRGGAWIISEASPAAPTEAMTRALASLSRLAAGSLALESAQERERITNAATELELAWDGDAVRPADGDERTLLQLAKPVFRERFSAHWPMDPLEDEA